MSEDKWADLERLAKAAVQVVGQPDEDDWFMPQHFANLEPEDAAFIAAANPAAVLELITAARRTPAPEGEAWRTVPVEPTEAMIAAANALWGEGTGVNYVQLEPEDFYVAMLAASPVVPVGVSDQQRAKIELVLVGYRNRITTLDAATDAILAALRPTDTGWRDIATAPKDGQSILAICGTAYSPLAGVTWWQEGWTRYSRPAEKWHGGVGKWFPTHWMPLPPAPTDTGRE
jgi:hypothetical protein